VVPEVDVRSSVSVCLASVRSKPPPGGRDSSGLSSRNTEPPDEGTGDAPMGPSGGQSDVLL